jgi:hypothetical protein
MGHPKLASYEFYNDASTYKTSAKESNHRRPITTTVFQCAVAAGTQTRKHAVPVYSISLTVAHAVIPYVRIVPAQGTV